MEQKTTMKSGKKLPENKFRAGGISATIWKNDTEKGSYSSVSLDRRYKDGDAWKSTASLRAADLPKAVLVLSKAYEYLSLNKDDSREEAKGNFVMEEVM